ncbi:MAG: biopolymer transporter ExbD [Planctomycetes bacterium]|nr:biopolymer transporter ExbD [Planctomycetota bacterium]
MAQKFSTPEPKMDMTPMIDVTFQLIIFLMLLANFSIENITLELASMKTAEEDEGTAEGGWVAISITRNGDIFLNRTRMGPGNEERTWRRFFGELEEFARQGGQDEKGLSRVRAKLRPDLGSKWCYLQMVQFCLSQAKIYRLQITANMPYEWEEDVN